MITLLSFGFSVGATRLFLELSGYPQLGGGVFHIAHVLWGGLFLFIASLLPIIYINEWIIALSGLISGFGVGLFIDEVGKFITQTNDYFFPSAAPIIYALFLLTVFIFTQVRIQRKPTTRSIFYEVLERLTEILDHDLSEDEAKGIQQKLQIIINRNDEPDLTQLAENLLGYFGSEKKELVSPDPTFLERIAINIKSFEERVLTRKRLKIILFFGLLVWAAWSLISPIGYLLITRDPSQLEYLINQLIYQKLITNPSGLTWFQARVLLEGSTGILAVISAFLMLIKKEKVGILTGIMDMLISLTIVNLFIFYFDQFSTILLAVYQFILLSLLILYQKRFLTEKRKS